MYFYTKGLELLALLRYLTDIGVSVLLREALIGSDLDSQKQWCRVHSCTSFDMLEDKFDFLGLLKAGRCKSMILYASLVLQWRSENLNSSENVTLGGLYDVLDV
jgi:hypothetical protein